MKIEMTIDSVVSQPQQRKYTTSRLTNTCIGVGASLAAYVAVGRDGLFVPATYTLADKYVQRTKFTSASFRDETIIGSIQTVTIVYPAYRFMNYAQPAIECAVASAGYGSLASAAGLSARAIMNVGFYLPLVLLGYYVTSHIVKKRKLQGIYSESIKPNFKNDVLRAYKWLGIPIMAAVTFVPAAWHVLTSAALRFVFRSMIGRRNKKNDTGKSYSNFGRASNYPIFSTT